MLEHKQRLERDADRFWSRRGHCSARRDGVPVVADAVTGRVIRAALSAFDVTVVEEGPRALALASTGAFRAVFATIATLPSVPGAVVLDPVSVKVVAAR